MRLTTLFGPIAAFAAGCIAVPEGPGIPKRIQDTGDGGLSIVAPDASSPTSEAATAIDPHAVLGVQPPHGPFLGENHAVIRGAGFASDARVWFGDTQVDPKNVLRADATKIQVVVPPTATPGEVDVRIQNGDDTSTARQLPGGYLYDPFFAKPDSGPTSGGTEVRLQGLDTGWNADIVVSMGGSECKLVEIVSPDELRCTTTAHPAATVPVTISYPDGKSTSVLDAFTYADSDNGFRGGLDGNPLSGNLTVAAYHAYTGDPVPGAWVVTTGAVQLTSKTDGNGLAGFRDPALSDRITVTLAKNCFEPTTFVDVPVDRVTAYLSPIISPACADESGTVPPVGGKTINPGIIEGELVWEGGTEFQRAPWTNVPSPKSEQEREVAYLFEPSLDPTSAFRLPAAQSGVEPTDDGRLGYGFAFQTTTANATLYALAGIEDRSKSPQVFTAYAFGLVQGVATQAGRITSDVYIPMTKALDQLVRIEFTPPVPGPRGPDRLVGSVSVELGSNGYALFPGAWKTLPIGGTGSFSFIGLPGLDEVLSGARFITSTSAVTGASAAAPMTTVGLFATQDASQPVVIEDFLPVPILVTPTSGEPFDGTHLVIDYASPPLSSDLTVVRVGADEGLVEWGIVVPGAAQDIVLPDLSQFGLALPTGPITISVAHAVTIDVPFDYARLQYRHLQQQGWRSYARDVFNGFY